MPKQDHLEIIGPDGKISFHYLDPVKGITNIGTHPENDLVLDSPNLAPFQAVIDHQRKPFRLMVLDEQANTRVQGKRIDSNIFQEIHDWETIELDGYSLTLLQDLDNLQAAVVPTPVPTLPPTRVDTGSLGGNGKAARQTLPVVLPIVRDELPPSASAPTQPVPAAPPSAPRVSFYSSRPIDVRDDVIVAELSGREWTIEVEQTATCDLVVTNGGSIVASFDVTVEG
ncbi:MAG: FHA domain-containing protein, partial [Chloroflexi bacterium]